MHEMVSELVKKLKCQNINANETLLLNQATKEYEILSSNECDEEEDVVFRLCEKLNITQTASFFSRYTQAVQCHREFVDNADIAMFGDSITEWGPWVEMLPNIKLKNRGIAGDTTKGMLRRVETIVSLSPNKVFLMGGINDLAMGCSVSEICGRFDEIIDVLTRNNIETFVQSTLFVGNRLSHLNPLVAELNAKLSVLCVRKNVTFLNVNEALCPQGRLPSDYSVDGLHPNLCAYKEWKMLIEPIMQCEIKIADCL
nr:GDSL-type esterase/lipase family protein [Enterovibrio nigricans]